MLPNREVRRPRLVEQGLAAKLIQRTGGADRREDRRLDNDGGLV